MSEIAKVHNIVWVQGTHPGADYHMVRFRGSAADEFVACVYGRPGYVSVLLVHRLSGVSDMLPIPRGAQQFEEALRREIETGEGVESRASRFRDRAESMPGVDPEWYGRELIIPVSVKGKSFDARYTIEGVTHRAGCRRTILVRSSRGKLREMSVPTVARYMDGPPRTRTRGRAIDLEV